MHLDRFQSSPVPFLGHPWPKNFFPIIQEYQLQTNKIATNSPKNSPINTRFWRKLKIIVYTFSHYCHKRALPKRPVFCKVTYSSTIDSFSILYMGWLRLVGWLSVCVTLQNTRLFCEALSHIVESCSWIGYLIISYVQINKHVYICICIHTYTNTYLYTCIYTHL